MMGIFRSFNEDYIASCIIRMKKDIFNCEADIMQMKCTLLQYEQVSIEAKKIAVDNRILLGQLLDELGYEIKRQSDYPDITIVKKGNKKGEDTLYTADKNGKIVPIIEGQPCPYL